MTPAAIRRELRELEQLRTQLETARDAHVAAVDEALAGDRFDTQLVAAARQRLGMVVDQLRDLDERRALLERALPTAAVIRQAEVDLEQCAATFARTSGTFEASAVEYFAALDVAEVVGRRLAASRRALVAITHTMLATAAAAGLPADVPAVPELTPAPARVAYLQGLLLADIAAHGEPDDVVQRDLASARAEAEDAHTAAA